MRFVHEQESVARGSTPLDAHFSTDAGRRGAERSGREERQRACAPRKSPPSPSKSGPPRDPPLRRPERGSGVRWSLVHSRRPGPVVEDPFFGEGKSGKGGINYTLLATLVILPHTGLQADGWSSGWLSNELRICLLLRQIEEEINIFFRNRASDGLL